MVMLRFLVAVCLLCLVKSAQKKDAADCTDYPCLIFEDNFDTLDQRFWEHERTMGGGGNWEFQLYTNNRSNSYVKDGVLYIKPTLTADHYGEDFLFSGHLPLWGSTPGGECTGNAFYGCERYGTTTNIINPIQSARLRSVNRFDIRYGRVEIQAQLPRGDWIWPALWMMPTNEEYGLWPASGEIDIMEGRGNDDLEDENGNARGNTAMGATLHWGPYFEANSYERTTAEANGNFADRMHTYAVEWSDTSIVHYLDDVLLLNVTPPSGGFWELGDFDTRFPNSDNPWENGDHMAPFDREFYIIMNVAVGGTNGYFSDEWTPEKPWSNVSPQASLDFWNDKENWYPTWNPDVNNGEGAAMKVNHVKVYKMSADQV